VVFLFFHYLFSPGSLKVSLSSAYLLTCLQCEVGFTCSPFSLPLRKLLPIYFFYPSLSLIEYSSVRLRILPEVQFFILRLSRFFHSGLFLPFPFLWKQGFLTSCLPNGSAPVFQLLPDRPPWRRASSSGFSFPLSSRLWCPWQPGRCFSARFFFFPLFGSILFCGMHARRHVSPSFFSGFCYPWIVNNSWLFFCNGGNPGGHFADGARPSSPFFSPLALKPVTPVSFAFLSQEFRVPGHGQNHGGERSLPSCFPTPVFSFFYTSTFS